MGRTSKAVRDEVRRLSGEGFGPKEISEKLKIDRSTAAKYSADKPGTPGNGCTAELEILFEAFFGLLMDLDTSAYLDQESLAAIVNDRALAVTKKLVRANKILAKKMLDLQVPHLKSARILDLTVPQEELSIEDLSLREEWMVLIKAGYPEKFGELV